MKIGLEDIRYTSGVVKIQIEFRETNFNGIGIKKERETSDLLNSWLMVSGVGVKAMGYDKLHFAEEKNLICSFQSCARHSCGRLVLLSLLI